MLEALKRESIRTCTENGGAAYSTTMSDCLDLFSTVGALRGASWEEIQNRFTRAWAEDRDMAVKIAFFARDVRGGLGERYAFRIILKAMARLSPETVVRNLENIPEYGRWDDLIALFDTPCRDAAIAYIKAQLARDLEAMESGEGNVSLMAKWLPSVNASSPDTLLSAKILVKGLGMTEAAYRKTLSALRARIAILENNLRERDYTFDYAKQPSKAMLKYRKAFLRNDGERYQDFLEQVCEGKAILHTGTLYPYDVIAPALAGKAMSQAERLALGTGMPCPTTPAAATPLWWPTDLAPCTAGMSALSPPLWHCPWPSTSPRGTPGPSATTSSPSPTAPGWWRSRARTSMSRCSTARASTSVPIPTLRRSLTCSSAPPWRTT